MIASRLDETDYMKKLAKQKEEEENKRKQNLNQINLDLERSKVNPVNETENIDVKPENVAKESSTEKQQSRDKSRDKMKSVFLSTYSNEISKKATELEPKNETSKPSDSQNNETGYLSTKISKRVFADDDKEIPVVKENQDDNLISDVEWNSAKETSRKYYTLPQFNWKEKNTIVVTFKAPSDSQAWSLNLSPSEDFYGTDILFHYNPRYKVVRANGRTMPPQTILNDRRGTWGDFTSRSMDSRPFRDCTVRIYITPQGFYLYTDSKFEIFFRHRRNIEEYCGQDLKLWFTYRDDNGNPHSVIIKRVIWQHNDIDLFLSGRSSNVVKTVNELMAAPLSANTANPMLPRTVLMQGLPILSDLKMLQGIEYNFFEMFKEFPEFKPSAIALVPETQYAFVRVSLHNHPVTELHPLIPTNYIHY